MTMFSRVLEVNWNDVEKWEYVVVFMARQNNIKIGHPQIGSKSKHFLPRAFQRPPKVMSTLFSRAYIKTQLVLYKVLKQIEPVVVMCLDKEY